MKLDQRIRDPIAIGTRVPRSDKLVPELPRKTRPAGDAAIWIDPTPTALVPWEASA